MRNRYLMIASFIGGCVALVALIVIVLVGWFISEPPIVRQLLAVIIAAAVIVLVIIGITNSGRERWLALLLAALLLLGFSALTIFSIGFVLAPISVILLVISIWRLANSSPQTSPKLSG